MDLSAEDLHRLSSEIVGFDSSPELQYLAGKKLLPQQHDIESFENPGLVTGLRRNIFGLTKKEKALVERQQEALVPFQQEQQILTKLKAQQAYEDALMPQTMGEVHDAGIGAFIKPLASQRFSKAPYEAGLDITPPVNPNAPLQPWQKQLASAAFKALAQGHTMMGPDGIVPTSFAAAQGRNIEPEVFDWQARAITAPPGEVPSPPRAIPPVVGNAVLQERGKQALQASKPIDLNNRLESLAAVESVRRFGRPMTFSQIAAADPDFAQTLRQQAEITEPNQIYNYQQDQILQRQLAGAGPLAARAEAAKREVDRDQPLAEPQLWRHPETGDAAPADMTTREAQTRRYVKLRPDQVETINQYSTIDDGLREVKQIASRVLSPKAKTPLGEAWRSMSQTAKLAYLRAVGDKDMLMLDSIITRLTAPLVKSQGDTANIAVAEREMFRQALVNNQASTEAVLANLDNVLANSNKVRKSMGFRVLHPEWNKGKPTEQKGVEAARARIKELAAQGKTRDEIKSIMTKEGY